MKTKRAANTAEKAASELISKRGWTLNDNLRNTAAEAAVVALGQQENLKLRRRVERTTIKTPLVSITLQVPTVLVGALSSYSRTPLECFLDLACIAFVGAIKRREGPPSKLWRRRLGGCHSLKQCSERWISDRETMAVEVEMPEGLWIELQHQASGSGVTVTAWALGAIGYQVALLEEQHEWEPSPDCPVARFEQFLGQKGGQTA